MTVALALAGRVLFSATASALQKKLTLGGVETLRLWRTTYLLMGIPAALALALSWTGAGDARFWQDAFLAGLLDALGNLAMVAALRSSDLSVFGPLNGFRPVLALLFGWIFLGERPAALGGLGVGVTVVGVALLLRDENGNAPGKATWQMLALRAVGLSLSTFAAVFLKRAALHGSTGLTLGVWILSGLIIFGLFALRRPRQSPGQSETGALLLSFHAAVFFVMQWLTLEMFRTTLLAYSFALFQLGMVLQVLMGRWLFHEAHFGRRLVCCGIIGVGALLITLAH